MRDLKPFDPQDIDETLTRVIAHGRFSYLMFVYVSARGAAPAFASISHVIKGPAVTVEDLAALSRLVAQTADGGEWFISFNTPWLLNRWEADEVRQRAVGARAKRD